MGALRYLESLPLVRGSSSRAAVRTRSTGSSYDDTVAGALFREVRKEVVCTDTSRAPARAMARAREARLGPPCCIGGRPRMGTAAISFCFIFMLEYFHNAKLKSHQLKPLSP